ncbi:2Fe-2S iron-sulfur cluster binding domain-containing protein [Bradyrhizobium tropiciagri]|uniref:(2Fe-2S)-binding protein n=1 Tax=Bradyrhizobium tropiciagri TaxID=312253 RepID=UPI001BA50909|nr:2Fe-2S iron-sulfur cluster-binding protein [Bradyrhizobium tropiciagri]MBR0897248.1 2Fe-2S iron-sulfur cluster binding domain-containing protein [Bradyrhizobium tropiciagri]
MITIVVNGEKRAVQSPPDTPLLYVLRNELNVMTPKFGCGLAQCGACSVLLDGEEIRSCITPVDPVADKEFTTVEVWRLVGPSSATSLSKRRPRRCTPCRRPGSKSRCRSAGSASSA